MREATERLDECRPLPEGEEAGDVREGDLARCPCPLDEFERRKYEESCSTEDGPSVPCIGGVEAGDERGIGIALGDDEAADLLLQGDGRLGLCGREHRCRWGRPRRLYLSVGRGGEWLVRPGWGVAFV